MATDLKMYWIPVWDFFFFNWDNTVRVKEKYSTCCYSPQMTAMADGPEWVFKVKRTLWIKTSLTRESVFVWFFHLSPFFHSMTLELCCGKSLTIKKMTVVFFASYLETLFKHWLSYFFTFSVFPFLFFFLSGSFIHDQIKRALPLTVWNRERSTSYLNLMEQQKARDWLAKGQESTLRSRRENISASKCTLCFNVLTFFPRKIQVKF